MEKTIPDGSGFRMNANADHGYGKNVSVNGNPVGGMKVLNREGKALEEGKYAGEILPVSEAVLEYHPISLARD